MAPDEARTEDVRAWLLASPTDLVAAHIFGRTPGRTGKPALSQGERVARRRRFSAGAGRVRGHFAEQLRLLGSWVEGDYG